MNQNTLLSLKILTPEGSILDIDGLYSINIPLADGSPICIRPGHAPLIAETVQGTVEYRNEKGQEIQLHAGVIDIKNNIITILTPGKVSITPQEIIEPVEKEYNRLMRTLVDKLIFDQGENNS